MTSTANAGPGSLREALMKGNRHVRVGPGVTGDVVLERDIVVRGSFITLDGTVPGGGAVLTVRGFGIRVRGSQGAHDVTIRNIRIRNADDDGIQVAGGAYNVLIENVSISGSRDGNLDITQDGTRDVMVRSSIIGSPAERGKNMLFGNRATGIRFVGEHRDRCTAAQSGGVLRPDAGVACGLRHDRRPAAQRVLGLGQRSRGRESRKARRRTSSTTTSVVRPAPTWTTR